jgi:signal transduction histidine kinase
MNQVSFAFTLTHELHGRLRWFGHLRWIAVAGLVGNSILGPRVGLPGLWPSLLIIAAVVAAYNLVFTRLLRRRAAHALSHEFLQTCAIVQIAFDLCALLVTVHFFGGLRSPILHFFVFHMVIGTILLSTRIMYVIGALTCLAVLAMHLAEEANLLPLHATVLVPPIYDSLYNPVFIALAVTIFGTIYLTGRVTGRLKSGSLRLLEMTMQLSSQTAQLERALAEVREIERRKSHYMRLSAHQLRSPLGTIKTSLDALTQGYVDPTSPRGQKLLHGVIERTEGLLMIVNDLLSLAKIREGQATAPWEVDLDLGGLLAGVLESLDAYAQERAVRIRSDIRPDPPALLEQGVREDLHHAFECLIQNAIKYSRPGGEVGVLLEVAGGVASLRVTDQGIGIPAEILPDIFLEFVRAPNAKHHAPEGTGIGLAIAREAIELHGGRITVASREGAGATFTVELPLAGRSVVAAAAAAAAAPGATAAAAATAGPAEGR